MPRASTKLPAEASSVPTARRWVQALLTGWGLPDTAWEAAQVISELTTNCALHARSDCTLAVSLETAAVRIEVSDTSPIPLQRRQHSDTATTGRGLAIVAALAIEWGVDQREDGKTVWVLLRRDDAPRSGGEAAGERPGAAARGRVTRC